MNKKAIQLVLFLFFAVGSLSAQNIQIHYDFGREIYDKDQSDRARITTTLEMFKPDSWGSTFYFVDLNIGRAGVSTAYTEIARNINFSKDCPLSAHIEYNGGLFHSKNGAGNINNAYLLGTSYTWNASDFSRGFSLTPSYKYIQKNDQPNNFQFTATWYINWADGLYSFKGFFDIWREQTGGSLTKMVSEPQFWINLNKLPNNSCKYPISIGTEIELSKGFVNSFMEDEFYCIPTIAMKWTF